MAVTHNIHVLWQSRSEQLTKYICDKCTKLQLTEMPIKISLLQGLTLFSTCFF